MVNIPFVANKNMENYIGKLRFCEDCIHRRLVDGLPKDELQCELFPQIKIFYSTDADKCISKGEFEELNISN